jgi:cysteine synthase
MPAPVVSSVLDLIGRTPIVRLRRVVEEGSATCGSSAST